MEHITKKIKWRFNDKPVEVDKMNSLEITHKWWIVGDFVDSNMREIRLGKYKMRHHAEAALKHWSKEGVLYRTFPVENVRIIRSPHAHHYAYEEELEWLTSWHHWQIFLFLHGAPCKLNNGKSDETIIKQKNEQRFVLKDTLVDVTYYIADDGKEFTSERAANIHNEVLTARAKDIAELKPCPFCGCTDIHVREVDSDREVYETEIVCWNNDCSAIVSGGSYTSKELAMLEAKAIWNKRVKNLTK